MSSMEKKSINFSHEKVSKEKHRKVLRKTPYPGSKPVKQSVLCPVSLKFDDSDFDFNINSENMRGKKVHVISSNIFKIQIPTTLHPVRRTKRILGNRQLLNSTSENTNYDTLPKTKLRKRKQNEELFNDNRTNEKSASYKMFDEHCSEPTKNIHVNYLEKRCTPISIKGMSCESDSDSCTDLNLAKISSVACEQTESLSVEFIENSACSIKLKISLPEETVPCELPNGTFENENKDEKLLRERVQYFILPKHIIFVLKHPTTLYFYGKFTFRVLSGAVKVLGHTFSRNKKSYEVYSPRGTSHLCFQTVKGQKNAKLIDMLENMAMTEMYLNKFREFIKKPVSVLALSKLDNNMLQYLERHVPQQLFPKKFQLVGESSFAFPETILGSQFDVNPKSWRIYREHNEWVRLVDQLLIEENQPPCMFICGGKSVGKSTFLRFTINKLLNRIKKVICIDLDIGQPEFTVPSIISATVVDSPLLGPSYTHLKKPNMSYYIGDVNVLNCYVYYMNCVFQLMNYCRNHLDQSVPWVVNYMGFSSGLGVDMITAVINTVQPTMLVQIQSKTNKLNFPWALTPVFVGSYPCRVPMYQVRNPLNYQVELVESAAEPGCSNEWDLEPKQMREMLVLSYLSQMLQDEKEITAVQPYHRSLSSLLYFYHYDQITDQIAAYNGNLVALCKTEELESNLVKSPNGCLGFGIIRGIDKVNKQIYLLTPVSEEDLNEVNSICLGSVMLPPSIYMTAGNHEGHVPYVSFTMAQSTTLVPKRSYKPYRALLAKK